MKALQLISKLGAAGIKLWLDEEQQLRFKAPKGALTPELKKELIAAKQDVIDFLAQSLQGSQEKIPMVDRSQRLPLSFGQQRLWFLDRLDPGNPSFHIVAALKIKGQLDIDTLRQCFQAIVARHESLRTTFLYQDNEVSQVIKEPYEWLLDENYDLSALDDEQQLARLNEIYEDEALRSFDLTDGTETRYRRIRLFRSRLARLSQNNDANGEFVLFITMHHIIADGWSIGILVKEISALYQAFKQNQADPLPKLEIQYPDFAAWQHDWLASDKIQGQLAYWKKQLNGISTLELPTDKPRPAVMRNRGCSYNFDLPAGLNQAVQDFSHKTNKTPFMVLMSAFQVLLYRYSGQSDICVGTPIANRTRKEIEPLIGCFINTLAIRSQVDGEDSFLQVLDKVSASSLDAFANQEVPFEQLVDAIGSSRDQSYTPIFQVMLSLENAALDYELELQNLSISRLNLQSHTAKYDLQLHIVEGEHMHAGIEYNTDLFEHQTIERLAGHFGQLLTNLIANPEQSVHQIQMMDAAQLQQLQQWGQNPQAFEPECLAASIEQQVARSPQAIACIDGKGQLSYQELNSRANRLAHYLRQQGVTPNTNVGICLRANNQALTAILAVIKAGGAYVPMDTSYPAERLIHMANNAEMRLVICDQQQSQLLSGQTLLDINDESLWENLDSGNPEAVNQPQDRLYMIFTSGSTGLPKAAAVSHANESNLLQWYNREHGFSAADKTLIISALGFDLTQKNLFALLTLGGSVVFSQAEHYDPVSISQQIQAQQISVINCAPSAFYPLVEDSDNWNNLHSLRCVLFGGEPIALTQLKPWLTQSQAKLVNMYGPTECTDIASSYICQPQDLQQKQLPIGTPSANVELHVLAPDYTSPMPIGATGELCISGAGVGLGYYNNPELNQKTFIDNPFGSGRLYRTGDLVRYNQQGQLEFVSRIDGQVKIRGFRIELAEIEVQLQHQTGVKDAVVAAKTAANGQQLLAAFVILEPEAELNSQQYRQRLSKLLPDYMVPSVYTAIEEIPLTPNGKVNRKALPEPDLSAFQREDFVAPRSYLEQNLASIWSQVLSVEPIGLNDNFFEVGGHSLLATKLVARIRDELNISVPLRHIFDYPVLEELAQQLEQNRSEEQNPLPQIRVIDRQQEIPMSAAQQRLWVIEQFTPGNTAYNMPAALHLRGHLDLPLLEQAFNRLIERHESLRTSFANNELGQGIQIVHPHSGYKLALEQSHLSGDSQSQLQTLLDEEARIPFDLSQPHLIRVRIIELAHNDYALLINKHHIISDGWSVNILQRELVNLYENPQQNLEPIAYQYADYAAWQQQWLTAEREQQSLNFWLENLADVPSHLNLPTDKPRPAQQSFNGAAYQLNLDFELVNQLNQFSQHHSTTLYTSLLSAYAILLSRYAQETDFCIGTPVAGRHTSELEPIIGYFINAVVLRCKLDGNPSVAGLVKRLRETSLEAFANQEVPVEKVLEALPLERNLSFPPLAQVGFNFISASMAELPHQLGDMQLDYFESNKVVAKYDLILIAIEKADGLALTVEYNSDLFEADSIANMMQRFKLILDFMLADPEAHIDSLTLLSPEEQFEATGVDREAYERVMPMTPMQRDLYLNAQLHPETLSNHLAYKCELPKDFDPAVWRQACQWLSDQYTSLRTDIIDSKITLGDMAYQCIAKPRTIVFEEIDLTAQNLNTEEMAEAVKAVIYRPFGQPAVQLMRYYYLHLPGDYNMGLAVAHHCIADGISMVLHWKMLAQKIRNLLDSEQDEPQLPPDAFAGYCERDLNHTDTFVTRNFWRDALANVEPLQFSLPDDHQRQGRVIDTLTLSQEHWQLLQAYCREHKLLPAMLIKMLYGLLIKAYCRPEADFQVAEFVAGRDRSTMFAQGNFFRQVPFVFPLELLQGATSITDLMAHSTAFYKQSKPFHAVSMMAQHQLQAGSGGLQFMFNYYPIQPGLEDIQGRQYGISEFPPLVENSIQFIAKQLSDTVQLDLMYDTDYFAGLGLLERMQALLVQVASGAETVQELQYQFAAETQQQLHDWNQTQVELKDHNSVQSLFEAQAAKTPDAIAVKSAAASLNYAQLNARANQLAHQLRQLGVGSNTRVGICLPRGLDFPVAVLGVIKAGGAYIPMDAAYPKERLQYMLSDAHAPVVISLGSIAEKLSGYKGQLIELDQQATQAQLAQQSADNPQDKTEASDLLYIIYTSGSTGRPKGAGVQHKGELNLLNWYCREFDFNSVTRTLVISALGFDLTQKNIFAPLVSGGCLVLPQLPHYDSGAIAELINSEQISLMNCAPSAFYPIVEDTPDLAAIASLETLIMGGEALRVERLQRWFNDINFKANIVNNYGPTECTDIAAFERLSNPGDYINRPVPIGRPNDNVQLYVLNDDLQLLPQGCIGELCIAGNGVGPGYLNHDDLNLEKFVANPFGDGQLYRSGDLVRYQNDSRLQFIGRKDFQVKLNGLRMELGEIEFALREQEAISDSLVTVADNKLVAYVTLEINEQFDADETRKALQDYLPGFMIPAHIIALESWPLTPNGKVDRKALPEPGEVLKAREYIAPRTETETVLAQILCQVLGISEVSVQDDFFELGGNSLAASRTIVQFRESFSIDIPLNVLFEMTTIEKIAEYIDVSVWANQAPEADAGGEEDRDEGFL